jgi:hypothetical protein
VNLFIFVMNISWIMTMRTDEQKVHFLSL